MRQQRPGRSAEETFFQPRLAVGADHEQVRCGVISEAEKDRGNQEALRGQLCQIHVRAVPAQPLSDVRYLSFVRLMLFVRMYRQHRHGLCCYEKGHGVGYGPSSLP